MRFGRLFRLQNRLHFFVRNLVKVAVELADGEKIQVADLARELLGEIVARIGPRDGRCATGEDETGEQGRRDWTAAGCEKLRNHVPDGR